MQLAASWSLGPHLVMHAYGLLLPLLRWLSIGTAAANDVSTASSLTIPSTRLD